jgi:hypothetical protein
MTTHTEGCGFQCGGSSSSRRPSTTAIITSARDLLTRYPVLFCDVWGVLHDGVSEYEAAGDALERYRAAGGIVVLLSNAPTPAATVARVLDEIRTDLVDCRSDPTGRRQRECEQQGASDNGAHHGGLRRTGVRRAS